MPDHGTGHGGPGNATPELQLSPHSPGRLPQGSWDTMHMRGGWGLQLSTQKWTQGPAVSTQRLRASYK